MPLLELLENRLPFPMNHLTAYSLFTPLLTPEHLPLTCDYKFQGVARLYLDRAGPVRMVAAAVTTYVSTRYIGDGECPIITDGSPELH